MLRRLSAFLAMFPRWPQYLLLVAIGLLAATPSFALWLGAGTMAWAGDDQLLSQFTVEDFLHAEHLPGGKTGYTIDFQEKLSGHEANKKFVEMLNNSIPLTADVKRQIGQALAAYGDICDLSSMSMNLGLAPVEGLPGPAHQHRIARLSIFDCDVQKGGVKLLNMPAECGYSAVKDKEGLDLAGLLDRIQACHRELQIATRYGPCYNVVQSFFDMQLGKWLAPPKPLDERGPANCVGDDEGITPLMAAAETAQPGAVERLLARGAKVDARDGQGRSVLSLAGLYCPEVRFEWAGSAHLYPRLQACDRIFSALRTAGAQTPPEGLQLTEDPCDALFILDHLEVMAWYLDHGVNPNCTIVHNGERSPLDRNVGEGNLEAVKLLLSHGARVEEPPAPGGGDRLALNLAYCETIADIRACNGIREVLTQAGWRAP